MSRSTTMQPRIFKNLIDVPCKIRLDASLDSSGISRNFIDYYSVFLASPASHPPSRMPDTRKKFFGQRRKTLILMPKEFAVCCCVLAACTICSARRMFNMIQFLIRQAFVRENFLQWKFAVDPEVYREKRDEAESRMNEIFLVNASSAFTTKSTSNLERVFLSFT